LKFELKEMPTLDRPRERLIYHGAQHLSTHELLAIILRTGSKEESVLDLAKRVLRVIDSLDSLNEMTVHELMAIKGIGVAKSVELLASIELGNRIRKPITQKQKISTPDEVFHLVKDELIFKEQEHLVAIYLNVKSEVIMKRIIYIGTINATIIHPREIFKWAYKYSSYAIILCHNHPSGDPTPSLEDIEMTKKLMSVGEMMGIKIIDHVVIGKNGFYSIGNRHR
jgi:DNA repair protein RadC